MKIEETSLALKLKKQARHKKCLFNFTNYIASDMKYTFETWIKCKFVNENQKLVESFTP